MDHRAEAILDGSEARGYTLYADINGDGDLTNDAQLKLGKPDGKYSYKFRNVLTETVGANEIASRSFQPLATFRAKSSKLRSSELFRRQ